MQSEEELEEALEAYQQQVDFLQLKSLVFFYYLIHFSSIKLN